MIVMMTFCPVNKTHARAERTLGTVRAAPYRTVLYRPSIRICHPAALMM